MSNRRVDEEGRMLVTVIVNLLHHLDNFKDYKQEHNITGDYEAKLQFLEENLFISKKTAENLLSGKIVSYNNYLEVFPSFSGEGTDNKNSLLEEFAESICQDIKNGKEDIIKEIESIVTNKLEKTLLKEVANLKFNDVIKNSTMSSLKKFEQTKQRLSRIDYIFYIWNSVLYDYILERGDHYEILKNPDENIIETLEMARLLEELGLLNCIKESVKKTSAMTLYNSEFYRLKDSKDTKQSTSELLNWVFYNAKLVLEGKPTADVIDVSSE